MAVRRVVLVSLLVVLCSSGSAWGWASGREGKLAFDSVESGRAEIWTINPDGTAKTQLTSDGSNTSPAWSPSGTQIAFGHGSSSGAGGPIEIMRADGSQRHAITSVTTLDGNPTTDLRPAWSRDGRQVAFVRSHAYAVHDGSVPRQNIYVVAAAGGTPAQLTDFGPSTEIDGLSYSPDGTQIVFTASVNGLYDERVYEMRADGGDLHEVAGGPAYEMGAPDWSPSGIVLTRRESGAQPLVGRVLPSGDFVATSAQMVSPRWSPALRGLRYAYLSNLGDDVYIGDEGGVGRRITWDGAGKHGLSWQGVPTLPSRPAIAIAATIVTPSARTIPAVVHCPTGSGVCALRVRITAGGHTVGTLAIRIPPGLSRSIRVPVRRHPPANTTIRMSLLRRGHVVASVSRVPVVRPVTLSLSCGSALSGRLGGAGTAAGLVTLLATGPAGELVTEHAKAGSGGAFTSMFAPPTPGTWQVVAQFRHQRSVPCVLDTAGPVRTNASIGCPASAATGDAISVSGSVVIPGAGVTLTYQPAGGDPLSHDVTTDGTGAFSENQILAPGTWTVTMSYGGDPLHAPASANCTIEVTRAASSLTVDCPPGGKSPSGMAAISGALSPALANQTITLTYDYATGGGTVTTAHTVQTASDATYQDSFAETDPGTITVHASWAGNDTNVPATSPACVTQVS